MQSKSVSLYGICCVLPLSFPDPKVGGFEKKIQKHWARLNKPGLKLSWPTSIILQTGHSIRGYERKLLLKIKASLTGIFYWPTS